MWCQVSPNITYTLEEAAEPITASTHGELRKKQIGLYVKEGRKEARKERRKEARKERRKQGRVNKSLCNDAKLSALCDASD